MRSASQNPFRGLLPFDTEDAPFFFGRDEVIDEVFDRLEATRAVAIIGPSGSGKSSLVRAGLVPVILEGTPQYRIAMLRPGSNPVGNLAAALDLTGIPAPGEVLRASSFGLANCVKAAGAPARLLLIVDQFEELFRSRFTAGAEDAGFFAALLATAILSDALIHILIVMRADFTGEIAALPSLPDALSRSLLLIPRMSRGQLTEAIERPLEVAGASIEHACVQRILNDLNQVADRLPLVQHVLMRMWESRTRRGGQGPVDLSDYEAAGTIVNALNMHAESVLDVLPEPSRGLAEAMFRSLSIVDESGRIYRRPTPVSVVAASTGSAPEMILGVARPFIANGLLLASDPEGPDTILDIAHESLLRVWTRLAEWVRAEADARAIYLRLVDRASQYQQGDADLLKGADLAQAISWMDAWKPNEFWATRYGNTESFTAMRRYVELSQQESGRRAQRRRLLVYGLSLLVFLLIGIWAARTIR